ncbi:MAG TPA: nucleotidyl transferase AbiEii/AbiGii toxin family protein [Acidobacteriota bacterium]|nr:nucleotidyl transferase AbiEii/AbiGii toxin family protein [Acidobacteriota bacterium]
MSRDFAAFLDALNKSGAKYVVIGGIAVLSHIPYRTTRDIDVLIEPTLENARRVREAVREWGGFEPEFKVEEFIQGDILSFGGLLRVEIHSSVPGVRWEQVWQNKTPGMLMGVNTWFASLEDLISMKEAAGRKEKDRPDLRRLKKLLKGKSQS